MEMSLFVNTNISSLSAQRQLFDSSRQLDTSFERLSSGFRINSASDDASGLQISDRMTSHMLGLDQAIKNANDGISLVQTADGALSESASIIQRMRQLAIQSRNGINAQADILAIQKEVNQLSVELDRISADTQFAGQNVLDGTFSTTFLVGANAGQNIDVSITEESTDFTTQGLEIGYDGSDVIGATRELGSGQGILSTLSATPGSYRFAASTDGGDTYNEVTVALEGNAFSDAQRIVDAFNEKLAYRGFPSVVRVGADVVSTTNEPLRVAQASTNPDDLGNNNNPTGTYDTLLLDIDSLDGALSRVNGVRAQLGATQNRFQSTIRNLANISENISAARGQIKDTDYASETANLARNQIIQQASTTVLAQANQRPQVALSLLG